MAYDVKKILGASLLIVAIGVALVVVSMILELLSLMTTGSTEEIISLIGTAYAFLLIPIFFGLYFWGGMRAVRKFELDAVSAGGVSAFSHVVTGLIHLALGTLLNILVVSRVVGGMGFGSAEAALAAALFGDAAGAMGIGLSAVCGFGIIIFGAMMNFVVGGVGALFILRGR